ncbi:MAG: hypothetical protein WC994_10845 [Brumimicrobium sp.]
MLKQTLKKSPLILMASSMLVFVSCQNETNENISESDVNTEEATEGVRKLAPTEDVESSDMIEVNTDASNTPQIEVSEVNNEAPAQNTPQQSAVKINPPHGEPGHDCAVPVGEPLPNSGGSTSGTATPSITIPQNTPIINNDNTVRINPPHGEPGHDCAVPVGQPLN